MNKSNLVSIGLRAKTGRAIAVVIGGSTENPIVLQKAELKLTDPKMPATAQPFHEVMDLPWESHSGPCESPPRRSNEPRSRRWRN